MRIITGTARGVKLETLEGEATRPTAERVKEALFSMIQFDLDEAEVLDLFVSVLRDAIAIKSGGKALLGSFEKVSHKLSDSLTLEKLLKMYEDVDGLLKSLENNPNYTLLSAVLCAKI